MMSILSAGLESLFGRWLTTLTVPLLILGLVVLCHSWWEKRDAKLLASGEMVCRMDWEQKAREQERVIAQSRVAEIQAQADAERQTVDDTRQELGKVRTEMDALRASAVASTDSACLSSGVLDALRARQKPGKKPAG